MLKIVLTLLLFTILSIGKTPYYTMNLAVYTNLIDLKQDIALLPVVFQKKVRIFKVGKLYKALVGPTNNRVLLEKELPAYRKAFSDAFIKYIKYPEQLRPPADKTTQKLIIPKYHTLQKNHKHYTIKLAVYRDREALQRDIAKLPIPLQTKVDLQQEGALHKASRMATTNRKQLEQELYAYRKVFRDAFITPTKQLPRHSTQRKVIVPPVNTQIFSKKKTRYYTIKLAVFKNFEELNMKISKLRPHLRQKVEIKEENGLHKASVRPTKHRALLAKELPYYRHVFSDAFITPVSKRSKIVARSLLPTTAEPLRFNFTKETYQKFGTSQIHGRVIYLNPRGYEVVLKETKIYLLKPTKQLDHWYKNYYLKNRESGSTQWIDTHYLNKTNIDLNRNFEFYGVAEGVYYIIVEANYPSIIAQDKKVYIAKKVDVGRYKKVMVVFRKKF